MQIHLFSTPGEQGIEYVLDAARTALAGKARPVVACLLAAGDETRWLDEARAAFQDLGTLNEIDVTQQPVERILATLDRTDLLYIPGGNTYLLARRLHAVQIDPDRPKAGTVDLIPEVRWRVLEGLPLVCFSAASVLCGPDILTTNDLNDCDCTNFEGLDLLPFNLNVHFPAEPGEARQEREERLQALLASYAPRNVVALEDGAYLRIAGDAIQVIRGNIWDIWPGRPATLLQPASLDRSALTDLPPAETGDLKIVQLLSARRMTPAQGIRKLGDSEMKTLLILRHAKSSWKDDTLPDQDRPLNKRGKAEAPRMGRLLRDQDLVPDLILSSDARRARATAEMVAEESRFEGEITFLRELYAAEPEAYLDALATMGGDAACVMVVGHNPGLEELLQELTGEYLPLPTAALAQVNLPLSRWSDINTDLEAAGIQGKLVNLWSPKDL
jgi:phosphohistidine phosphatase